MELDTSYHKRSKSDYSGNIFEEEKFSNLLKSSYLSEMDMGQLKSSIEPKKRPLTDSMVQNTLKEEILELQKQLENQFAMRQALQRALCHKPFLHDSSLENSISKPAKDLIKDIATLELEVVYLEKYLLSMYRKTFAKKLIPSSMTREKPNQNSPPKEQVSSEFPQNNSSEDSPTNAEHLMPPGGSSASPLNESLGSQILEDYSIHRSHSSLSHRSAVGVKTSPSLGPLAVEEAVESYHSLPLFMLERAQGSSNVSLPEHLVPSVQDRAWGSPNRISEEMIKCISAICCKLADPPLNNYGFPSSPGSISSSRSSPRDQNHNWSQHCSESSLFNSWLDNSFRIESPKEFSFPFQTVAEIHGICRDQKSLNEVEDMIQKFRSLISFLEFVDPKKMKHEEKLAFWINVHNALVMHAYLVYGVPRSNIKRMSLLLKAAYNIGGHTVSVDMIQSSILGCRLPRPGQWLQSLFFSRAKYRAGDTCKLFATGHPEPRLYFALCSGSHSDPMLRVYTPRRVFQELEVAKEEYIQTNMRAQKDLKLLLPKRVDSFVKELDLCPSGFAELIEHALPGFLREKFQQPQQGKFWKKIVWVPHDFAFRYLIADELVN
ncbi:uncharacterized protein LOC113762459 isoform X1 [Coffea eugenioides]|uniref:uncharacterized protein LOC113762459 isoform X1 n=1 Tax=Coffea eugenioides TaxID=49369 RepID=UPI000F60D702|nr:uncharacterized protein LOC113762459 isoform X1 [Coffea eugenioides]